MRFITNLLIFFEKLMNLTMAQIRLYHITIEGKRPEKKNHEHVPLSILYEQNMYMEVG
jgi:hypothetical protein